MQETRIIWKAGGLGDKTMAEVKTDKSCSLIDSLADSGGTSLVICCCVVVVFYNSLLV